MKQIGMIVAGVVILGLVIGTRGGEKNEPPLDKNFLIKAAGSNHAEIEISKLADKRADAASVKDFATMLVKDHKDAFDQLAKLLNTHKLGVVAGLNKERQEEVTRLNKLEGGNFDRAYLQCMIKEHTNAIAIFESQAKNGRDEVIRAYAKDTLPTLRKHLSKAKTLAKTFEK